MSGGGAALRRKGVLRAGRVDDSGTGGLGCQFPKSHDVTKRQGKRPAAPGSRRPGAIDIHLAEEGDVPADVSVCPPG